MRRKKVKDKKKKEINELKMKSGESPLYAPIDDIVQDNR
jgi:hypothetical protein